MSRIGKNPINIPEGVQVTIEKDCAKVKSANGEIEVFVNKGISVSKQEETLLVERSSEERKLKSLHGTTRQLLANAIIGVSEGFSKELELHGIGYQANTQGKRLKLQLGYSHDILFEPPDGISITANKSEIKVSGIDKQMVGEVAAKIRSFRKPEPYKGNGIRYKGEYVRSKQGKTVGGAELD